MIARFLAGSALNVTNGTFLARRMSWRRLSLNLPISCRLKSKNSLYYRARISRAFLFLYIATSLGAPGCRPPHASSSCRSCSSRLYAARRSAPFWANAPVTASKKVSTTSKLLRIIRKPPGKMSFLHYAINEKCGAIRRRNKKHPGVWLPGVLYAAEKLTQLNQRKMQVFRFGHTD